MMPAPAAWLALWNDVDAEVDEEYNGWHAQEHVPQRLTVPGITAAHRYERHGGEGTRYFTWYALASAAVLQSDAYLALLANPTPWSRRMRPHILHVTRHLCQTRHASVAAPGERIRDLRLPSAARAQAMQAAGGAGLLVGEVDASAPPLPWMPPGPADTVAWVRLEDFADAAASNYTLRHQYSTTRRPA